VWSFTLYATLDPTIASIDGGMLHMDREKLKQKGNWGDN